MAKITFFTDQKCKLQKMFEHLDRPLGKLWGYIFSYNGGGVQNLIIPLESNLAIAIKITNSTSPLLQHFHF